MEKVVVGAMSIGVFFWLGCYIGMPPIALKNITKVHQNKKEIFF